MAMGCHDATTLSKVQYGVFSGIPKGEQGILNDFNMFSAQSSGFHNVQTLIHIGTSLDQRDLLPVFVQAKWDSCLAFGHRISFQTHQKLDADSFEEQEFKCQVVLALQQVRFWCLECP